MILEIPIDVKLVQATLLGETFQQPHPPYTGFERSPLPAGGTTLGVIPTRRFPNSSVTSDSAALHVCLAMCLNLDDSRTAKVKDDNVGVSLVDVAAES